MAKTQNNPTILDSGVKKVKGAALSLGHRAKRRPVIAALAVAFVLVLGGAAYLAIEGLPDWEALDQLKATVGAKPTLAELAKRAKAEPKDADAQVELGHALFEAGKRGPALRSYERGLSVDSGAGSDRVIENLLACYGKAEQSAAHASIVKHKLLGAEAGLHALTRSRVWLTRNGAIQTLEKLGKAGNADYLSVWTLDLRATDCDVRRHAVEKLATLGDRRALDDIRAAKKKDADETPWYGFRCLGDRPDDAEKKILARK